MKLHTQMDLICVKEGTVLFLSSLKDTTGEANAATRQIHWTIWY